MDSCGGARDWQRRIERPILGDGFVADAVFCGMAVSSWFSIPRNGVARDGSGIVISDHRVVRPFMWHYQVLPWPSVQSISLVRSTYEPEMRGATAFYRCELAFTLAEWRESQRRWLPPWFERVRTTTVRARLTASEHERELLEQEINRMRGQMG